MNSDFNVRYKDYLLLIENRLSDFFKQSESEPQQIVLEAMAYSLLGGGKRIRAILALEFCRQFSGNPQDALDAACAIEMIHAYSLIHDDLPCMDDDDMRRGKLSCHKKYGEAIALLAGDALFTEAMGVLFRSASKIGYTQTVKMARVLTQAAGVEGMVGGQVLDMLNENREVDGDLLLKTYSMKTGALIEASVHCGCLAAKADEKSQCVALNYAQKIGLAFQISDDILDVTGDEAAIGKPVGSDEKSQKSTYVSLYGLEKSKLAVQRLYDEAFGLLDEIDANRFLYDLTEMLKSRTF